MRPGLLQVRPSRAAHETASIGQENGLVNQVLPLNKSQQNSSFVTICVVHRIRVGEVIFLFVWFLFFTFFCHCRLPTCWRFCPFPRTLGRYWNVHLLTDRQNLDVPSAKHKYWKYIINIRDIYGNIISVYVLKMPLIDLHFNISQTLIRHMNLFFYWSLNWSH